MGKRSRRKNKNNDPISPAGSNVNVDVDSDDSDTSVTTTLSGFTSVGLELNELNIFSHVDELDEVLAELTQKRGEIRMKAFQRFNGLLCKMCCRDWVEKHYDAVTDAVRASLKRSHSSPELSAECVLVCRTLGLLAISVHSDAVTNLFEIFYPLLESGFTHNTDHLACKQLCDALSALCIFADDTHFLGTVMNSLIDQWMNEERSVKNRASLLHAWYVCITCSNDPGEIIQHHVHVILDLMDLLEIDSVLMRIHAAECITLFFSLFHEISATAPLEWDLEEEGGLTLQDVIETFTVFSGDRRSAPKKQLSGQRKKFRILLDALENGTQPEITFKIRREPFSITGINHVIQVELLRKILRGGFQIHLIDNDLIHRRFGLTQIPILLERNKEKTQDEKAFDKYSKVTSKKDWQKKRNQQRNAKQAKFIPPN